MLREQRRLRLFGARHVDWGAGDLDVRGRTVVVDGDGGRALGRRGRTTLCGELIRVGDRRERCLCLSDLGAGVFELLGGELPVRGVSGAAIGVEGDDVASVERDLLLEHVAHGRRLVFATGRFPSSTKLNGIVFDISVFDGKLYSAPVVSHTLACFDLRLLGISPQHRPTIGRHAVE